MSNSGSPQSSLGPSYDIRCTLSLPPARYGRSAKDSDLVGSRSRDSRHGLLSDETSSPIAAPHGVRNCCDPGRMTVTPCRDQHPSDQAFKIYSRQQLSSVSNTLDQIHAFHTHSSSISTGFRNLHRISSSPLSLDVHYDYSSL